MGEYNREETDLIVDESQTSNYRLLYQAIEQHWKELLPSIRVQIKKLNLAIDPDSVEDLAQEILNDSIVQALENYDKYNPDRPALPWLRKIAFNQALMLRRRRNLENQHVTLVVDKTKKLTEKTGSEEMAEDEMFDLLYQPSGHPKYTLDDLLSLVNDTDRQILELVFVHGLRGKSLAAKLGVSEGAAWMKQNRAIARLSEAFMQSEQTFQEEK